MKFVGDNQKAHLRQPEGLGGLRFGDAVEKERQVKALFVGSAVVKLAHQRKEVALEAALRLGVEHRRRAKVRHVDGDARFLEAMPQDIQAATASNGPAQRRRDAILDLGAVMLHQPRPRLGLRADDEVADVGGEQAAGAVVLVGGAAMTAAGRILAKGRRALRQRAGRRRGVIWPIAQQRRLNRGLEVAFGDVDHA